MTFMADIGYGSLILAFLVALYAIIAFALSLRSRNPAWGESARNAALAVTGLVTLASLCLLYLLLAHDYSVSYVFGHVNNAQPLFYTLAAFWAGQEGSLLFWLWMLALLSGLIALRPGGSAQTMRPHLLATLAGLQAFLLLVQIIASNPFVVQAVFPGDGQGLNPLLQNFWMIVHPPVVFIGYALYAIPFALVIAGLWSGELGAGFWSNLRRWSLWGWLFLGMGILLGAWWAYVELGWGGYWGWDPVENSSLIPWLIGTAFLHTAIAQERRGMYRLWALLLTAFTFLFCLFATFVTRSGIIQSVHAFGRSSIGYIFLAFMGGLLALLIALLYWRRARYADEYETSNLLSREASFLFVNLLLLGVALVIFFGTIFPTLSEISRGVTATLNSSFYVRASAPLFVALFALLGVCPLLAWGQTSPARLLRGLLLPLIAAALALIILILSGVRQALPLLTLTLCALIAGVLVTQYVRDALARRRAQGASFLAALAQAFALGRRRYGAHIVHLALVFIVLGVTGSAFDKAEQLISLKEGERARVGGYELTHVRTLQNTTPQAERYATLLELTRNGGHVAYLTPERNWHWNIEQWVSEVAIHSNLAEDVYVILGQLGNDGRASLQVLINPLVIWIWIGGFLLFLGTVVTVFSPSRAPAPEIEEQAASDKLPAAPAASQPVRRAGAKRKPSPRGTGRTR
jgi:cytochrome c-type biogenesis protein CcmF